MTNLTGVARTNYFPVKDDAAFRQAMGEFEVEVVEEPIEGVPHFAVFDTTNGGAWPIDKEGMGGKLIPVCFYDTVAEHLPDGAIAVFMGVSYMNTRSVHGHALAIDNAGNRTKIQLDDIYDQIKVKWGREVGQKVQY